MAKKRADEDIVNEEVKDSKDEEMWLKKAKNKFKSFEITGNEVEGEEKIRKINNGKKQETMTEEGKKNNNKINNDKFDGELKDMRLGMRDEEGKEAWQKAGKKYENPFKKEMEGNNNNNNNEVEVKKKYVAGKIRIIEGPVGPIPKMIEIDCGGKKKPEPKRRNVGKGKKKLRKKRVFGIGLGTMISTQLEEEIGNLNEATMVVRDERTQEDETEEAEEEEEDETEEAVEGEDVEGGRRDIEDEEEEEMGEEDDNDEGMGVARMLTMNSGTGAEMSMGEEVDSGNTDQDADGVVIATGRSGAARKEERTETA